MPFGPWPGSAGASVVGSVFSMLGPPGAAVPVVTYDFTKFDPALTVAQNLQGANLSGNAAFDLTAVANAQIQRMSFSASVRQSPFAWEPMAARVDGGGLFCGGQADFVVTTGSPAAMRPLGAMTAEMLFHQVGAIGAGDNFYFNYTNGGGGVPADNTVYQIHWNQATGLFIYSSHNGAGIASNANFDTIGIARLNADTIFNPVLMTLTRSAGGTVRLYFNGRLLAVPVNTTPPTDGSAGNFSLGFGAFGAQSFAVRGFRLFNSELTPTQVRASHRLTMFGFAPQ